MPQLCLRFFGMFKAVAQQAVLCTTHSWAVLMLSTCKPAFAHTPNSWALSACMRPLCCSYRLQGKLKLLETHTTSNVSLLDLISKALRSELHCSDVHAFLALL